MLRWTCPSRFTRIFILHRNIYTMRVRGNIIRRNSGYHKNKAYMGSELSYPSTSLDQTPSSDGNNNSYCDSDTLSLTVITRCKSIACNRAIACESDKKLVGRACNGCRHGSSMIRSNKRVGRRPAIVHINVIATCFGVESKENEFQVGVRR